MTGFARKERKKCPEDMQRGRKKNWVTITRREKIRADEEEGEKERSAHEGKEGDRERRSSRFFK